MLESNFSEDIYLVYVTTKKFKHKPKDWPKLIDDVKLGIHDNLLMKAVIMEVMLSVKLVKVNSLSILLVILPSYFAKYQEK